MLDLLLLLLLFLLLLIIFFSITRSSSSSSSSSTMMRSSYFVSRHSVGDRWCRWFPIGTSNRSSHFRFLTIIIIPHRRRRNDRWCHRHTSLDGLVHGSRLLERSLRLSQFLIRQTSLGNSNGHDLTRRRLLRTHLQNTIDIDFERDIDFRFTFGHGRDTVQIEFAQ
mmetsp:Transcript_30196/g.44636  ORF Transcript_30196/g.44636 Transcript_30196/m.44636 type:complete len:166 (-) Transcript_30196:1195-1692(-)